MTIEQLMNSVGYLVSFITKDKVLQEARTIKKPNGEILTKSRRMVQRILLTRLYLRQSILFNTLTKHSEALEASRQAFFESCITCLDTIILSLMIFKKIDNIKKNILISQWSAEQDPNLLSTHDRLQIKGEIKALRRIAKSSNGVNSRLPEKARSLSKAAPDIPTLDKKQEAILEHLKYFLPIALELKKFIENINETMKNHKKIKKIDDLIESIKGIQLYRLNMAYLYSNFTEEHYLYKLNIIDIIRPDLLNLKDLDFEVDMDSALYQVSSQSFVEKISWLTIAYYSVAIEKEAVETILNTASPSTVTKDKFSMRFRNNGGDNRVPDSQVDLGKALELAYLFLPQYMPCVMQIFKIYESTKNAENMAIVIYSLQ